MALSLPNPAEPLATSPPPQQRAHRKWRSGQGFAQREQWAQAALEFEQAYKMHDDAAYGLAAAHAFIRAGRSDAAAQRTQSLRRRRPALTLAYTIESHALLERGDPAAAVTCLLALPADAPRDAPHWVALGVSLQRCHRHEEAIAAFMQALVLKIDDPIVHFRLGMSFKDRGMKAEAAECVRTALLLGLDTSELAARAQLVFLEREACRWAPAAQELARLRAAVQAAPLSAPVETGPFPHAVFVDDPLEQHKVARLYALHVANRVNPLPRRLAKAHEGRLRIGYLSADFHQHATSQLMVQMLECHDRSRYEVTLFSAGADDASAMRACAVDENVVEYFATNGQTTIAKTAKAVRRDEIAGDHGAVGGAHAHTREGGCARRLHALQRAHRREQTRRFRAQILGAWLRARKPRTIDDVDVYARACECARERRSGGTTADDQNVRIVHSWNSTGTAKPPEVRPRRRSES